MAVNVGFAFTDTLTTAELVHVPFDPITVYVVFTIGLTTTLTPDKAPGFHVYEVAPLPVSVAEFPAQITVGLLRAVTVGIGFTVKLTVFVSAQFPFEPTTV